MARLTECLLLTTLLCGYHLVAAEHLGNITINATEPIYAYNGSWCVEQNIPSFNSPEGTNFCINRNDSSVCCTSLHNVTLTNCTSVNMSIDCSSTTPTLADTTSYAVNMSTTPERDDCEQRGLDINCDKLKFYLVVGGAPAAFLVLVAIILIVSICCCKRKKKACFRNNDDAEPGNLPPSVDDLGLKPLHSSPKSLKRRGTRPNSYVRENNQRALIPPVGDYGQLPMRNDNNDGQEDYENIPATVNRTGYVNVPNDMPGQVEPSEVYEDQPVYGNVGPGAAASTSQANEQEMYMDMQKGSAPTNSNMRQEPPQENYETPDVPPQEDYETPEPEQINYEEPTTVTNHPHVEMPNTPLVNELKNLMVRHKTQKGKTPPVESRMEEYDYTTPANVSVQHNIAPHEGYYADHITAPTYDDDEEIYQNAAAAKPGFRG